MLTKRKKSTIKLYSHEEDFSEIAELFEEGLNDEEIAKDIKMDVSVVKKLREKFEEDGDLEKNPFTNIHNKK